MNKDVGGVEIKLKNDIIMPVREVLDTMDSLRGTLYGSPKGQQIIEELLHWCQGNRDLVSEDTVKLLSRRVLTIDRNTGEPVPAIRTILPLAFRRVPDGVMLFDPYENNEENQNAIQDYRKEQNRMWRKRFGGSGPSDYLQK